MHENTKKTCQCMKTQSKHVKTRAKGCGQKRPLKDQQPNSSFNGFEVLDSMVLKEGIPPSIFSDPVFLDEVLSPHDACGAS